jgi:protein-tyrosine phosphatase
MSPEPPFRILVVCTGNICRSPMAQAMLTHELAERVGAASAEASFVVESAGTFGLAGQPIEPSAASVLAGQGVDLGPFTARELSAEHVEDTDLILGATREHRAAVANLAAHVVGRTFTIREFARLVGGIDWAQVTLDGSMPQTAHSVVAAAVQQRGHLRPEQPADDDVADPYGRSPEAFVRAGVQIDAAVQLIAAALTGSRPPS